MFFILNIQVLYDIFLVISSNIQFQDFFLLYSKMMIYLIYILNIQVSSSWAVPKFFCITFESAKSVMLYHLSCEMLTKLFIGQKGGSPLPIHRSHSVPVLSKDESIRQLDSLGGVFRVVRTPPRAAEVTVATAIASPTVDAGKFVHLIHLCFFVTRK